jgi:hypothetical protein
VDFPYRNIVEFLRNQLWQRKPGRAAGRASLMIGAGFSLNAEPVSASARPFPLWAQLTRMVSEAVYPGIDPATVAPGTSGFLRLAQEFEAAFGKFSLEELIRGAVPDAEHRPGSLHTRLLSLPWADVFTTNWDTLVERARLEVPDRLYDVVLTPSQISSASVPRIVKLHGTLPSHTPFVFTEEDYRTYPRRFAPFVNMVQQAMVENAFVLLGFSGDDPNFLAWSGWVRDNLGPHAPKIYLVGHLDIGPQRRRMLEERNVVPVDLATLPQAATWPEELRHRYATEWFLQALESGRPPRAGSWPSAPESPPAPPPHLVPVLPSVSAGAAAEPWPQRAADLSIRAEDLSEVASIWAINRRCYPGWELAPYEVRARLWQYTEIWLVGISHALSAMDIVPRIAVLRELIWRLDTCLVDADVVGGLVELIQDILKSVNFVTHAVRRADDTSQPLSAEAMEGVRLMLRALLRLARREGNLANFNAHVAMLEGSAFPRAEMRHEIQYERLLWHAQRLEHEDFEAAVGAWDVDSADPMWGIRKATLLLEISRIDEAGFTLRAAFARLRRERRRDTDDPASLSKEAWGLWLTRAWWLPNAALALSWNWPNAEDRWRDLSLQDCNAAGDYQSLLSELLQAPQRDGESFSHGFDVGVTSINMSFASGLPTLFRAAQQLRRLAEITAVPASVAGAHLLRDGLARSITILADHYPLACAFDVMRMARDDGDDIIKSYFSRARIATLDALIVAQVTASALSSLEYAFPRARPPEPRHNYWLQRLRVSLEVLSRTVLRSPPDEALNILGIAERLYQAAWPVEHLWTTSALNALFKRCIESLPAVALWAQLPRLLVLPIPGTPSFLPNSLSAPWMDPAEHVGRLRHDIIKASSIRSDAKWRGIVQGVMAAAGASAAARLCATSRLELLRRAVLLTEKEESDFAALVWAENFRVNGGLPDGLRLNRWAFLIMPEPAPGVAAEAFRQTFLRDRGLRPQLDEVLRNLGHGLWQSRVREREFILSEEDAVAVGEIVREWAERPIPSPIRSLARNAETSSVDGLGLLLTEHRIDPGELAAVWTRAEAMESAGLVRAYCLFPALARAFPGRVTELVNRLRRGLVSAEPKVAEQAFFGLYRWLDSAANLSFGIPGAPEDLIGEIGAAVAARRPGAISRALDLARWVFDEASERARELIAPNCDIGLTYLISEASYEAELRRVGGEMPDTAWLRQISTMLALAMEASGHGSGAGATAWLAAAIKDPMPEVRRLVEGRDRQRQDLGQES